jgi:hypothetical protein
MAVSPLAVVATKEESLLSITNDPATQYTCDGDPALKDHYPAWVDNVADNATVEGSMLDGVVVGGANVRSVVLTIKSLYDRQEFLSIGPYGDNAWIENYVAEVRGEPLGCVVVVERNSTGETQHVIASYRPRTTVVHFARLLAERFAGNPLAEHVSAPKS